MGLVPGYNLVRSGATREFQASFERAYNDRVPERVSILHLLRLIEHEVDPPHRCLQVDGFDDLWRACDDPEALRTRIKRLFSRRSNWIKNHFSCIYFVLPAEVTFIEGRTLQMRLQNGRQIDLDVLFSGPVQQDQDHWNKGFALS